MTANATPATFIKNRGESIVDKIKNKIAKLLALAESPNENEAKAALLRARELMAEHKLRPEEIQEHSRENVIKKTIGITCTKMTNPWVLDVGSVIAKHYCCVTYRGRHRGKKIVTLGLIGLEDDFAVCEQIIRYACACVEARCRELRAYGRHYERSGKEIRESCNAYGYGFAKGLEQAYAEQDREHQEWGLVLTTPQPVLDVESTMGKKTKFATYNLSGQLRDYASMGMADGKKFDPGRRIPESEQRKALA